MDHHPPHRLQQRLVLSKPRARLQVIRRATGQPPSDPDWIGYRRREVGEPEGVTVFSSWRGKGKEEGVVRLDEAASVVREAERTYSGHGARVEFCVSRGVDYDRSVTYLPVLEGLERAHQVDLTPQQEEDRIKAMEQRQERRTFVVREVPPLKLLPRPQFPPTSTSTPTQTASSFVELAQGYFLRVRIYGLSDEDYAAIVERGCCPLCGQPEHPIIMCPRIPNELRPFC